MANTAPRPVFHANSRCSRIPHCSRSKMRDVERVTCKSRFVCESFPESNPALMTVMKFELLWLRKSKKLLSDVPSMTHFSTSDGSTCSVVAMVEYDKSRPMFSNPRDVRLSNRIFRSSCASSKSVGNVSRSHRSQKKKTGKKVKMLTVYFNRRCVTRVPCPVVFQIPRQKHPQEGEKFVVTQSHDGINLEQRVKVKYGRQS
jgi:hypothetical protein